MPGPGVHDFHEEVRKVFALGAWSFLRRRSVLLSAWEEFRKCLPV